MTPEEDSEDANTMQIPCKYHANTVTMQIPYFWCVLVDDHRWRRRRRRRSGGGGIAGGRSFFFKFASPHGEQRRRSSGPLFNAKAIYEMDVTPPPPRRPPYSHVQIIRHSSSSPTSLLCVKPPSDRTSHRQPQTSPQTSMRVPCQEFHSLRSNGLSGRTKVSAQKSAPW
jgi:hypothetical protein